MRKAYLLMITPPLTERSGSDRFCCRANRHLRLEMIIIAHNITTTNVTIRMGITRSMLPGPESYTGIAVVVEIIPYVVSVLNVVELAILGSADDDIDHKVKHSPHIPRWGK